MQFPTEDTTSGITAIVKKQLRTNTAALTKVSTQAALFGLLLLWMTRMEMDCISKNKFGQVILVPWPKMYYSHLDHTSHGNEGELTLDYDYEL